MKILSLDTSATPVFAAVEVDENNRIENFHIRVLEQSRGLSRDIILAINEALEEAGWSLDDLDAIAAGLGPGSWTGLRVGLSTAKTIAQARNLPLLGISTFDAFALAACKTTQIYDKHPDDCLLVAAAPCRSGEIYTKMWRAGTQNELVEPEAIDSASTLHHKREQNLDLVPVVLATWESFFSVELAQEFFRFGCHLSSLTPDEVAIATAQLATMRWQNGERDDPLSLNPLYLAPSSAERVRAEKLARENQ
jgi:tRNA threonylcarbamoyl adenosine modification protein YeaZ